MMRRKTVNLLAGCAVLVQISHEMAQASIWMKTLMVNLIRVGVTTTIKVWTFVLLDRALGAMDEKDRVALEHYYRGS